MAKSRGHQGTSHVMHGHKVMTAYHKDGNAPHLDTFSKSGSERGGKFDTTKHHTPDAKEYPKTHK